jgi:hypothetical protein
VAHGFDCWHTPRLPGDELIPLAHLLAAMLASQAAPPEYLLVPGLGRLVARVVDAYGGDEVVRRHVAMVQEGEVTSVLNQDGPGHLTRIFQRPGRLRVTITYPGSDGQEQRVLDGRRAWRDGNDVSGTPSHRAMELQAARLDLPYLMLQARDQLVDGGEVVRDGRRLQIVTIPLSAASSVTAEIDLETALVVRSTTRMQLPQAGLEFVTEYSDHRKVDGTLVPFREVNHAQGRRTGTTVLQRTEFLREAPTGAFEP